MFRYRATWKNELGIQRVRYVCGYCGTDTTPAYGWFSDPYKADTECQGFVAICTNCNRPSFVDIVRSDFSVRSITPSAKMGRDVSELPSDVDKLYEEARLCTSAGAYTAAILTCRKILMHIAVEKGAKPNLGFIDYVDYLAKNGYIPPDGRDWIDYIRTKSNEANHEIMVMGREDAEDLITFVEMLLRLVYEFKNRLAKKTTQQS